MRDPIATLLGGECAGTLVPVRSLTLSKTKIYKDPAGLLRIIEKIGGLDVAMEDLLLVDRCQCEKETLEVETHLWDLHVAVVLAEVAMLEIWQDGNNLIEMTKGSDQRTHRIGSLQIVEQIEFVEDTHGTARHVNLLDGDIVRASRVPSSLVGRRPLAGLALVNVPAIVVFLVLQVFRFVYS